MMYPHTRRSLLAGFCITLILLVSFAPVIPGTVRPAHAQLPVTDAAVFTAIGALSVPTTATAAATGNQFIITSVLNGLAWQAANVAIQSMTKSVVNWINSGFDGSPAFVTDLNRNLGNLSDAVADDFLTSLEQQTGVNVRSPWQDKLTVALRNDYYASTGNGAYFRNGYTLDKYSSDPNGFVNGNFQKGSFDAWFQLLGNDQNNPVTAFRSAKNELTNQIITATDNRKRELDWGKGFLSWRGPCNDQKAPGGSTPLSTKEKCASYSIRTPGSMIVAAAPQYLQAPLDRLKVADSINEIVGALAQQLVGQVLGGAGLAGLSGPSSGGGPSYLDRTVAESQSLQQGGASLADGFASRITSDIQNATEYQTNWNKLSALATQTQQQCTLTGDDSDVVASIVETATANTARAAKALTALQKIQSELSGNQTSAASQYQNLLSSGTLITESDLNDSRNQNVAGNTYYSSLTAISSKCARN